MMANDSNLKGRGQDGSAVQVGRIRFRWRPEIKQEEGLPT